jgi:hypothetical protein
MKNLVFLFVNLSGYEFSYVRVYQAVLQLNMLHIKIRLLTIN